MTQHGGRLKIVRKPWQKVGGGGDWAGGRTMKMMEGFATSSTAMVRRLRCSTLSPLRPGLPTMLFAKPSSSTSSITCKQQADLIHVSKVPASLCKDFLMKHGLLNPCWNRAGEPGDKLHITCKFLFFHGDLQ